MTRAVTHAAVIPVLAVAAVLILSPVVISPAYCNQSGASGNGQAAAPVHIMAFGDSLTAGYGLPNGDSYPAVLEQELRARGYNVRVSNAGVSGDTSAGGLARLGWALADAPDILILELGANDALQGLPPENLRDNLAAILEQCAEAGVRVLLAGMRAPRNMGAQYATAYDAIYPELARKYDVPLYPFFLDGVALDRSLNQADGVHPNAKGVRVIVNRLLPHVEALL